MQFVDIFVTVVEPKLALFEMEIKSGFVHTSEFNQSDFSIGPKRFYAVDMRLASDKFIIAVLNTEMFVVSEIDQTIVTTPTVRIYDAFDIDTTTDQCL